MKDEKKMSFCVGRNNQRRKISWLLRSKMQLRMSKRLTRDLYKRDCFSRQRWFRRKSHSV